MMLDSMSEGGVSPRYRIPYFRDLLGFRTYN
jgi:hypothetical protein